MKCKNIDECSGMSSAMICLFLASMQKTFIKTHQDGDHKSVKNTKSKHFHVYNRSKTRKISNAWLIGFRPEWVFEQVEVNIIFVCSLRCVIVSCVVVVLAAWWWWWGEILVQSKLGGAAVEKPPHLLLMPHEERQCCSSALRLLRPYS